VKIKSTYGAKLIALGVIVRIPVPKQTAKAHINISIGKAKYNASESCIVWKVTAHGAYTRDSGQRTPPTPGSLQGEYRAGGCVHTRPAGLSHPWGAISCRKGTSTYLQPSPTLRIRRIYVCAVHRSPCP